MNYKVMEKMGKVFKLPQALIGMVLMIIHFRFFPASSILKNKSVAIIGPADSAYEETNGKFIDSFDYVIRLNKAIVNWDNSKEKFIGTKTDILIHSFQENDSSGGGKLDFELFENRGIRYVINAKYSYLGFRTTFNFYKKYLSRKKVYILSRKFYKKCNQHFSNKKPTNGFRAISMVFEAKPKKIFISGFTFFKTPYVDGYRDLLGNPNSLILNEKKRGLHDPDKEFAIFLNYLKNSESEVLLDRKLDKIVKENI
jgi:hypothetical protein